VWGARGGENWLIAGLADMREAQRKDRMKSGEAPKLQMPSSTRDLIKRPAETQEKRKAEKEQKAKKRPRRGRAPVYFWAFALSFLWMGSFAAFGYGAYGNNPEALLTLDPIILAALAALMFLPVGFIWVGAAAMLRLTDLNETALRLATVSRDLIDPTTTAANDVAKLGATIRKELEGLNREVDGAVTRVGMLETRLHEQTTLIGETAREVEARTSDMTARLAEEREKVETITQSLADEGRTISETFDAQSLAIDSSAEVAVKALKDAEGALTGRTEDLSKAAGAAVDTTKSIAEDIEREVGKLESVSANARSRSEAITARFGEQHKLMAETVDQQAEQQSRLDAAMDQQQRLISKSAEAVSEQLAKMSETVSTQTTRVATQVAQQIETIENVAGEKTGKISSEVTAQIDAVQSALAGLDEKLTEMADSQLSTIETAVSAHTGELTGKLAAEAETIEEILTTANRHFAETVEGARARAVEAGEGFAQQAAAMEQAANAATADLNGAVDLVKRLAVQTREDLEGQVKSADTLFQEQAHNARDLLRQHADEMGAALEGSINEVRERLIEFSNQGNDTLLERSGELDGALRRSEQRMRSLYQRLDESIEGITLGTDAVGKRLAETADAFEARMAQFPAHAEDAANKVHEQINHQIENLARIADSAAEKAQVLVESPVIAAAAPETKAEKSPEEKTEAPVPAPKKPEPDTPTDKAPELPGRDVYPQIWDGMDRGGPRRPRIGRPVLGPFDDLAKSLADRFRKAKVSDQSEEALKAAAAVGVLRQEKEDISDFRIVRRKDTDKTTDEAAPAPARPAPEAPKTPLPKFEERGWKDILASVDRQEKERSDAVRSSIGEGDDASFQQDALLIIEKLQAMSIDIDRALEDTPPTDLLDRYMSGERNVFARRLASFTTPEMLEKIARKHREDSDFRRDLTTYIESFEELLKAARGRDRENVLLETYLTSQTGKVYMILGTAIGHLNQGDV